MLPWAIAAFFAIATTRRCFPRHGAKPLFTCGITIDCVGVALLATPWANVEAVRIAAFAAMGFGASLCTSTSQSAAFVEVPADRMSDASALWNINRQLSFVSAWPRSAARSMRCWRSMRAARRLHRTAGASGWRSC